MYVESCVCTVVYRWRLLSNMGTWFSISICGSLFWTEVIRLVGSVLTHQATSLVHQNISSLCKLYFWFNKKKLESDIQWLNVILLCLILCLKYRFNIDQLSYLWQAVQSPNLCLSFGGRIFMGVTFFQELILEIALEVYLGNWSHSREKSTSS